MKTYPIALLLLLTPSLCIADSTADTPSPPPYYQENCIQCHQQMVSGDYSLLYTRSDSLVKNYKALRSRVAYCEAALSLKWKPEQVDRVTQYLNKRYYKFPAEQN